MEKAADYLIVGPKTIHFNEDIYLFHDTTLLIITVK